MSVPPTFHCSCGQETPFPEDKDALKIQCPKCGQRFLLPRPTEASLRIHVEEADLAAGPARLLAAAVLFAWLALYSLALLFAGWDNLIPPVGMLLLLLPFAWYLNWKSDGMRMVHLVHRWTPLWILAPLSGLLIPVIAWTLPHLLFPAWVLGLALFALGWHLSLSSTPNPVVFRRESPDDTETGETFEVSRSRDLKGVRSKLRSTVLMHRSFAEESSPIETFSRLRPGGPRQETLRSVLQTAAREKNLHLLALLAREEPESHLPDPDEQTEQLSLVDELTSKVPIIVLTAGVTPGLVWETENLIQDPSLWKQSLIVFPRERPEFVVRRWEAVQNIAIRHDWELPSLPAKRNWDPLLVRFLEDRGTEWWVVRRNWYTRRLPSRAYRWGFSRALSELKRSPKKKSSPPKTAS